MCVSVCVFHWCCNVNINGSAGENGRSKPMDEEKWTTLFLCAWAAIAVMSLKCLETGGGAPYSSKVKLIDAIDESVSAAALYV